jgi:macrolide-specific efflux system membrane fusion protein
MISFLKRRWYLILILLLIGGGFYFYQQTNSLAKAKQEKTYTVKRQNLQETLSLSGKIEAEEKTTLRFQTSGMLSWVGVKEGDFVKKYQVVAMLDQREVQKNLQKYLNTYMDSRWDFEQAVDDNKTYVYQTTDLGEEMKRLIEQAQFSLNNAVIDVELKDLAIKYSRLSTPIEGIVVKVGSPYSGVNITPTQAEIEIVNPETVYFSVTADQTEVVQLTKDMNGDIVLDSYPDKQLKGQIYLLSFTPKSGETGTVYEARMKINDTNKNYQYRLGMTGDATFNLREIENVLAIPTTYIKSEDDKKYVMIKKGDAREKVYITPGIEVDVMTQIKKGLKEGDIVVQ